MKLAESDSSVSSNCSVVCDEFIISIFLNLQVVIVTAPVCLSIVSSMVNDVNGGGCFTLQEQETRGLVQGLRI